MVLDRVIRYRDAPAYLGMDRNRFDREVRPMLTEIPIGGRGIGFDRLDLDAWFEQHKECNGRSKGNNGADTWSAQKPAASTAKADAALSTDGSKASESIAGSATPPKRRRKPGSRSGSTRSGQQSYSERVLEELSGKLP